MREQTILPSRLLTVLAALMSCVTVTAHAAPAPGECPQPRFTGTAPAEFYERTNPLPATPEHLSAGERRFVGTPESESCAICHGRKGDGKGVLARQYDPPPRNFTCAKTIVGVPDGQLFWIIRYGSPGTAMPPHSNLTDEQTWQLVHHLRHLAK